MLIFTRQYEEDEIIFFDFEGGELDINPVLTDEEDIWLLT